MPRALSGRSAFSSRCHDDKVSPASSGDSGMCAFRHSTRDLTVTSSTCALSAGFPGRLDG